LRSPLHAWDLSSNTRIHWLHTRMLHLVPARSAFVVMLPAIFACQPTFLSVTTTLVNVVMLHRRTQNPGLEQLVCIQSLLKQMLAGTCPTTAPEMYDRKVFSTDVSVTSQEWKDIASCAYIWLDYFSVPQIGAYHTSQDDAEQEASDLIRAVNSIPAYIEHTTHFFALCPTVQHSDLPEITCDFASWKMRGWCRVEFAALFLARTSMIPAIVVKGDGTAKMMSPLVSIANTPGLGTFTCCSRNHLVNGRRIKCDREVVGSIMLKMLMKRYSIYKVEGMLTEYRAWRSVLPHMMRGLTSDEMPPDAVQVDEFVRELCFDGPRSEEGKKESGLTPLGCAAMMGNSAIVRKLIVEHGADANGLIRKGVPEMSCPKGLTTLQLAMGMCARDHEEVLGLLINEGRADISCRRSGLLENAIVPAIHVNNLVTLRALTKVAGDRLDVNAAMKFNGSTPLGVACFMGTLETIVILLDAGANPSLINDHGGNNFHDLACNPNVTEEMLELMYSVSDPKLVSVRRFNKTVKWFAIDKVMETLVRFGSQSPLAKEVSVVRGSTPLHEACFAGNIRAVEWFLMKSPGSLHVKNMMGYNPADLAKLGGHPEVMESDLANPRFSARRIVPPGP